MASVQSPADNFQFVVHMIYEIDSRFVDRSPDGPMILLGNFCRPVEETICSFNGRGFLRERNTVYLTLAKKFMSIGIDNPLFVHEQIKNINLKVRQFIEDPGSNIASDDQVKHLTARVRTVEFVDVHGDVDMMSRVIREWHLMDELLERGNYGMEPASKSSIENMLKKLKIEGESQNCRICLEEFFDGEDVTSMPCSHQFHGECIVRWLHLSHYCPICRYEMPI